MPTQVNYVAKGTRILDFAARPSGAALAVCRWLTLAWLIPKIREQGGAYGASLDFDRRSGYLALTSYRDPNLIETLSTYDGSGAFLRASRLSDSDLVAQHHRLSERGRPLSASRRQGFHIADALPDRPNGD